MTKLYTDKYWFEKEKKFISENIKKVYLKKGEKEIILIGYPEEDYEFVLLDRIGYKITKKSKDLSVNPDIFITDLMWVCNCTGNNIRTKLTCSCCNCGCNILDRNDSIEFFLDHYNYDNVVVGHFNNPKKKRESKKIQIDRFKKGPFK